jgi:uncharacterized serine/threonine-protein kinase SgK494
MGNKQNGRLSERNAATLSHSASCSFAEQTKSQSAMNSENMRIKRRLRANRETNVNENRSSMSPGSPKYHKEPANHNGFHLEQANKPTITNLKSSPQTYRSILNNANLNNSNKVIKLNDQMKSNQKQLTNIIQQMDSSPASYQTSSKLYKPSSLLLSSSSNQQINKSSPNRQTNQNNTFKPNNNKSAHLNQENAILPNKPRQKTNVAVNVNNDRKATNKTPFPNQEKLNESNNNNINNKNSLYQPQQSPKNVRISPKIVKITKSNTANSLSTDCLDKTANKVASKLSKKLGLSPKFKRKIVETINNRINPSNLKATSNNNLILKSSFFSQSRLLHAFQSQWNLFTSFRLKGNSSSNGEDDEDEDENADEDNGESGSETSKKRHRQRTDTDSTFLSTSLQRNSFRYASRRKYKTQSLANPYRHANTNYPVYIHEALFMPEFSVKGQVTEADFEILDVISRGAFGHVIKVKKKYQEGADQQDEQIYAMKIMWKSQVIRDRALQQVKDEVTIATSCVDNPLIVKTWYYWQSKRFLYIITDYVENGELLSLWLKVHHFPERLVALYAVEMSLVLDYLHKHGIIYRDIKMENILLDQRGHIQLIDFGLSKWLKLGERTGTICGTIQYMAPEVLSVEPYDHAVDWWSLGILIYALLSGEYPLNAAKDHIQMNEKVSKHIFELDRSRGNYSEQACDLVRKLLRKNPHRRLKSLNEIKNEPFFHREVNGFINNCLLMEKQEKRISKRHSLKRHSQLVDSGQRQPSDDSDQESKREENVSTEQKRTMISENFWNPYVIMQNYSPLEMLYDELYKLKQKQREKEIIKNLKKSKTASEQSKPNEATDPVSCATSPPPPPPPSEPISMPTTPDVSPTKTPETTRQMDNSASFNSTTTTTRDTSSHSSSHKSTVDDLIDDELLENVIETSGSEEKHSFEYEPDLMIRDDEELDGRHEQSYEADFGKFDHLHYEPNQQSAEQLNTENEHSI